MNWVGDVEELEVSAPRSIQRLTTPQIGLPQGIFPDEGGELSRTQLAQQAQTCSLREVGEPQGDPASVWQMSCLPRHKRVG